MFSSLPWVIDECIYCLKYVGCSGKRHTDLEPSLGASSYMDQSHCSSCLLNVKKLPEA